MIVISDTSVVNALLKIECIDCLPALFQEVLIPPSVYEELQRDDSCRIWLKQASPDWLSIRPVFDTNRVADLLKLLDLGESEAIALGLAEQDVQLLMDEKTGRAVAESFGLRVTGTLGVLLAAKRSGLISSLKPFIHRLLERTTFRISPRLLQEVLVLANE